MRTWGLFVVAVAGLSLVAVAGYRAAWSEEEPEVRARAPERGAADGEVTGRVRKLTVSGEGQNSAEILFVVRDLAGKDHAFVVRDEPVHEPQVFAANATLLTAAHVHRRYVRVTYRNVPNETARTISVTLGEPVVDRRVESTTGDSVDRR